MQRLVLVFFGLFIFLSVGFSQKKKIKIKSDKSVRFIYQKDSSCFDKAENSRIMNDFYSFFKALQEEDYGTYAECLSLKSKESIDSVRLRRKFKKLVAYKVGLKGRMQIHSIKPFKEKRATKDSRPIYKCILALPRGQSIKKRVGFDPLKRAKMENVESYIGLLLEQTDSGYKVAITH
jgi:hypothetical protein